MTNYPFCISSVKRITFTHPNDIRTGAARFIFADGVEYNAINTLLDNLPNGYSLSFFDADFPQWSDPGVYFAALRYQSEYYIQAGNHGWMTNFKKENVEVLKQLIWACIKFNSDEGHHFTVEKHLYNVATCQSFTGGLKEAYQERLAKL